ncbi:MAG: carbamoyltransferase HypF, partial [Anaerolineae bacterium]|nr:carbamoyltransferase HypF [Anaerolineae bacterium]
TGNGESRRQLADLADAFLMHDRDIHTRCDDSVVRVFSTGSEKKSYPLRRSRGFTPFPIMLPRDAPPLLATGAELKNTFCLVKDRYAFLSHHIGDMENYETLLAFESGVAHFEHLFRMKPEFITHDLHPDYMATRHALQRAEVDGIAAVGVQHHHAHIAACMLDNGLSGDKPMIGVAFDGTGYGQDGNIWGGEFLLADYGGYERAYHLAYAPLAGGDQAVRQPWRMALAWLSQAGLPWEDDLPPVQHASQLEMEVLQHQLASSINTAPTSSMGRLFDAAASLCGVRQIANYEAQAAIEFEALVDPAEQSAYQFEIDKDTIIDPTPLFHCIIDDLRRAVPGSSIAARFHNGVAKMVLEVCLNLRDNENLNQVALSGGVWQNMALLEKSCQLLSSGGFEVYTHHKVPTNDGGLALGQAAIGAQIALRTQSANQSHRWREKACA